MRIPTYQQLSKKQDEINNLPLDASHLVIGPPGTGKSVMALYRAQMYMKSRRDIRLLVHSRLLSQYTEGAVKQLGIEACVETFHSWWSSFYRRVYGQRPPQLQPYVYDWTSILHTVAQGPSLEGTIPYLIIDEGQDLPKEFYVVARHLAANLTVFADENQRLTEDNSTIEDIKAYGGFAGKVHVLNQNYRNTREIAELAATFDQGLESGVAKLPERSGPRPSMWNYDKLDEVVQQILRFEKAYSDLEIGVFTPTKKIQKQFLNRLEGRTVNPVQAYVGGRGAEAPVLDFSTPGVKIVNYPSTKGLEFDAVFVPELQKGWCSGPSVEMQLYVLVSRARERLFLGYEGAEPTEWTSKISRDLVDWT